MTTMLEVAKRVEVSETTVSRVLSGNGHVSQGARDRVFQTVEENGYHPNLLAHNPSAKSTQTLGLIVTNTLYHGIYLSELLFHAARVAEGRGRQLLLADDRHSVEEEHQVIQYLLDLRCDAIMIHPRFLSVGEIGNITNVHSQSIMVLNRCLHRSNSHSVWCDHKQTSFSAVAELITIGRQEIIFLTGSMDPPTSVERPAGYKDALAQHGTVLNEKPIASGKWTPTSGTEGAEMLLERGARFSALVASNDNVAIGAIRALHEHGAVVLKQVSVIGFNDIAIAPYIVPAPPSVKIPVIEVVRKVIGRLIFMLDGGGFSPPKALSGKLIRHGSLITLSR